MTQLPLFSAEQEATRTLQEQFDLLCHDYRSVEARLDKAREEYRALRRERDAAIKDWRACLIETDRLTRERDAAQIETRHWKAMYDLALMMRPTVPAPASPTLEPTLKKLLTIAHPDKWSQGQDATTLAHEITVVLNQLRQEGRP